MPPVEIGEMHAENARRMKLKKDSSWRRNVHERGEVRKDLMRGIAGQTKIAQKDMYHAFRKIMSRDHPTLLPTLSNFFHSVNPEIDLIDTQERQMYYKLWEATVRDNDLSEIDMILFNWTTNKVFGNMLQEEQARRQQLKDDGMSNEDLVAEGLCKTPELQSNNFEN